MRNNNHSPASRHNFSLAFEKMCSMVAISQTKSADETLRELLLQCIALLPDQQFHNEQELSAAINSLYGLQIPAHEVLYAIEMLISERRLIHKDDEQYVIPRKLRSRIETQIEEAYKLEKQVRSGWEDELSVTYPGLDADQLWEALKKYLAQAFQRHGIQTTELLNPYTVLTEENSESLSVLLEKAIASFPTEQHIPVKNVIASFLTSVGGHPNRAKYITQLADAAFNYFNLTVAPEVAEHFRKNLKPLILFLDTNFLFGILGLTINSQVAVSNELLHAIAKYNFPFELRSHEKTEQELLSSIGFYETNLSSRAWSRSISRAASTSRYLSGVELRYHQKYAETGIDVDSFFRPYRHADVLLREKNIASFNSIDNRLDERAKLFHHYEDFLKQRGRDKSYRLIDHDTTVLDVVRMLRSNAPSSLEAGALLITCDYSLYRYDWETSRTQGRMPSTVLPNLFWQIMRPFVPSDVEFERAFAETFAIPEFRMIGSGASEACSKMLNILASYKDFPEETATNMLSNDLLIEKLRRAETDEVFQTYVEEAVVIENAELVEEKAILTSDLERERQAKAQQEAMLIDERRKREQELAANAQLQAQYEQVLLDAEENKRKAEAKVEEERLRRETAEKQATEARNSAREAQERLSLFVSVGGAIIIAVILIGIFELFVYKLPWVWLVNHPNSFGLQTAFSLMLLLFMTGLGNKKWRKGIWSAGILPLAWTIIQLLGGL